MRNRTIHRRQSRRWGKYDYAANGMYFVTICTINREKIFGHIHDGMMILNTFGKCVEQCWRALPEHFPFIKIDAFVIMPNHVHGIIHLRTNIPIPGCVGATHALPLRTRSMMPRQPRKPPPQSLCSVIGSFKSAASKHINVLRNTPGGSVWQRNYHDRIIRDIHALEKIRRYIGNNPQQHA